LKSVTIWDGLDVPAIWEANSRLALFTVGSDPAVPIPVPFKATDFKDPFTAFTEFVVKERPPFK
jgi:hypothetical protein